MAGKGVNWRPAGIASRPASVWLLACGLAAILIVAPQSAMSQDRAPESFDHSAWDRILELYIDEDGLVAYRQLGQQDRSQLDVYLNRLAEADPDRMGEPVRLAFWINAYNAGIVDAILRGYSPESTLSRAQPLRWQTFRVAGKDRAPHEVEHDILRKEFREPRIHFALVCGTTGCPKLRREAYRGVVIEQQLDDQARRFINDPLGGATPLGIESLADPWQIVTKKHLLRPSGLGKLPLSRS